MPAPLLAVFDDGQGNVYHAELQVGGQALIMINGVNSALRIGEPLTLGAASAGTFVRRETDTEVKELHRKAVAADAEILLEPEGRVDTQVLRLAHGHLSASASKMPNGMTSAPAGSSTSGGWATR